MHTYYLILIALANKILMNLSFAVIFWYNVVYICIVKHFTTFYDINEIRNKLYKILIYKLLIL